MDLQQPRQVEWRAAWRWTREALALMARRPLLYSAASMLTLALFLLFLRADSAVLRFALVLLLPPLALVGFLRLARAADCALPFSPAGLLPSNGDALRVLTIAGLGYGVAFAALFALGALGEGPGDAEAAVMLKERLTVLAAQSALPVLTLIKAALFGASVTAFCSLLLALCSWFTLPLVQFSGLPIVPATLLSFRAYRMNARALGVMGMTVFVLTLLVLTLTAGLGAVLIAPFAGALLYVSYRDIFLGRAQNAPVPARAKLAALPHAA